MDVFKYFKELLTSPVEIVRNLYLYRHMLFQMVKQEIKGRFAGSFGGLIWNFIQPIMMMLIYIFVFVYIFQLRIGHSGGTSAPVIYIMSGLFPWFIMAEGLTRGTSVLFENANLIKKTSFPIEILMAKAVIAPLCSIGITIALLTLYQIIVSGFISVIYIPVIMILQVFFTLGIVFLNATISVFFRDFRQIVQIIISFGIFISPIFYPISRLPDWAQKVMYINPVYPFVSTYHSLFLDSNIGQWHILLLVLVWSIIFFVIGSFIFNKLKYEFADWL